MQLRWSMLLLAVLGVAAALFAALLVASLQRPVLKEAAALTVPDVTILVATRSLAAAAVVKESLIEQRTVSSDEAPLGYFSDTAQVLGRVLSVPVTAGQAYTQSCFPVAGSGLQLAAILPDGKRAVSISLTEHSGLEGLLYPGSRVDLLASFRMTSASKQGTAVSTTLLQNIQVLAVENITVTSGREDSEKPGASAKSNKRRLMVTLMVDNEEAEAVQLAMEFGSISLAMRNPTDAEETVRDATLLSEGRLAQFAQMMSSSIQGDEGPPATPSPEKTMAVAAATPDAPKPLPQYAIDVIRGTDSETLYFPQPRRIR